MHKRTVTEKATNNAGPAFRPTPQRDSIFRDAKVLLFWCDQQQKELLVRYFPFVVTSKRVVAESIDGLMVYRPLTSITGHGATGIAISKF